MIPFLFWTAENLDDADIKAKEIVGTQEWSNISVALHIFLPVAGLMLFWGRRDIFSKLLMQLDRSCVSVFCPSFSKRERLLKWATTRLPLSWSSQTSTPSGGLLEFWRDGSLLCTIINSAVPGACPNPHRHWKKSMSHGQALAYKYLGIAPIFNDKDFDEKTLTIHQERNLIKYLWKIQLVISKLVEKDGKSQNKYSSQYVARGMGLFTGEQHRKTVFYIYSNVNCNKLSDVIISIKGPYNTFGKATISPIRKGRIANEPIIQTKINKTDDTKEQISFLKSLTNRLMSSYENKESECDIPIETITENERMKVSFIPKHDGIYELCIISDGELLKGSPFNIHITKNESNIEDSFKIDKNKRESKKTAIKRKILSKVIDFIDERLVIKNFIKYGNSRCNQKLENIEEDLYVDNGEISDLNQNIFNFVSEENNQKNDIIKEDDSKISANDLVDNFDTTTSSNNISDENDSSDYEYEIRNTIKAFQEKSNNEQLPSFFSKAVNEEANNLKNNNKGEKTTPSSCIKHTSPICSDHIVPEVEVEPRLIPQLSSFYNRNNRKQLLHKIKSLTHQTSLSTSDDTSSMLSENESDVGSESSSFDHLYKLDSHTNLSVLNVLNSLRNEDYVKIIEKNTNYHSIKNYNIEYKLNISTEDNLNSSLPNLNSDSDSSVDFKKWSSTTRIDSISGVCFKKRREYWDKMCSLENLHRQESMKQLNNQRKDVTKPKYKTDGLRRNICSSLNSVFRSNSFSKSREKIDFSYSLKDNVDERLFLSVRERKAILLEKLSYEQQVLKEQKSKKLTKIVKPVQRCSLNRKPSNTEELKQTKFGSISEKIQIFDKSKTTKLNSISNEDKPKPETIECIIQEPNEKSRNKLETTEQTTVNNSKIQFKTVQNFFKELEQNVKNTNITNQKTNLKRRFSLDSKTEKRKIIVKGTSSLNLTNVSERFFISNLYEDIFGDKKRGKFRGSPNKTALANSLASIHLSPNNTSCVEYEENELKFNMFVQKCRIKQRESVKSLFDVHY